MAEFVLRRAKADVIQLEDSARYYRDPSRIILPTDTAQAAFVATELIAARKKLRALLD